MLWAALMAVVGTGLVWRPVAIYLLATGAILQGIALISFGVLVIGLMDNILRPILIGQNTRIPDYLVSTLGGIATFGASGFVIGPVIAATLIAARTVFSERDRDHRTIPLGAESEVTFGVRRAVAMGSDAMRH